MCYIPGAPTFPSSSISFLFPKSEYFQVSLFALSSMFSFTSSPFLCSRFYQSCPYHTCDDNPINIDTIMYIFSSNVCQGSNPQLLL